MHCSKVRDYSITSSARASSVACIVRPSALAVLRLITVSGLVMIGIYASRILSGNKPADLLVQQVSWNASRLLAP
jgi:hypothetical protein